MSGLAAWVALACAGGAAGLVVAPRRPRSPGRVRRLISPTGPSTRAGSAWRRGRSTSIGSTSTRGGRDRGWLAIWWAWCAWLGKVALARWSRLRGTIAVASSSAGTGPTLRGGPPTPSGPGADPGRFEGGAEARLGAALTVGFAALVVSPVLVLPTAAVTWAWPGWRARGRRARWQRDLVQAAPDLVEMFRLSAGAGLSVHQSVHALAHRATGPAGAALGEVVAAQARGVPLADCLDGFGTWGEAVRPLASALAATQRYGVALGPALDRASVEAREVRRRQAEESARRLPVLMLFPLVVCILPAAGLLTVVPLLVASWPQLKG